MLNRFDGRIILEVVQSSDHIISPKAKIEKTFGVMIGDTNSRTVINKNN